MGNSLNNNNNNNTCINSISFNINCPNCRSRSNSNCSSAHNNSNNNNINSSSSSSNNNNNSSSRHFFRHPNFRSTSNCSRCCSTRTCSPRSSNSWLPCSISSVISNSSNHQSLRRPHLPLSSPS